MANSAERAQALRALQELFPAIEKRTLLGALVISDGVVDDAVEYILENGLAQTPDAPASAPAAPAAPPGAPPTSVSPSSSAASPSLMDAPMSLPSPETVASEAAMPSFLFAPPAPAAAEGKADAAAAPLESSPFDAAVSSPVTRSEEPAPGRDGASSDNAGAQDIQDDVVVPANADYSPSFGVVPTEEACKVEGTLPAVDVGPSGGTDAGEASSEDQSLQAALSQNTIAAEASAVVDPTEPTSDDAQPVSVTLPAVEVSQPSSAKDQRAPAATPGEDAAPLGPELSRAASQDDDSACGEDDDVVVVSADVDAAAGAAGDAEADDPLGWSTGSLSLLGSQIDITKFSTTAFDTTLNKSADLMAELLASIKSVESLRAEVEAAEGDVQRKEAELAAEREREEKEKAHMAWVLEKARNDVDMFASDVCAEKSTLHYEARQLSKRLEELNALKRTEEKGLAELRAILEQRVRGVEARMQAAGEQAQALAAEGAQRRLADQEEMNAIAARTAELDQDRNACLELKEFLNDRSKSIDAVEGDLLKCSEKIKRLRESILNPNPRPLGATQGPSTNPPSRSPFPPNHANASVAGGSENFSAHSHSSGEFAETFPPTLSSSHRSAAMHEALGGLLSSSEGGSSAAAASSSCSTPLHGSQPFDPNRTLQMLSLMRSQEGPLSLVGSQEFQDFAMDEPRPPVRVFEDAEPEGAREGAAGAAGGAATGSTGERSADDEWEDVAALVE